MQELTDNFNPTQNTLKSSFLISISAGFLALTTTASVLWCFDVTERVWKITLPSVAFLLTFCVALVYFLYFAKRQKLHTAIKSLATAFNKDID